MSIVLKTPSNGSVTLAEQDTASNVTVTIPARTASVMLDGPAFSAYQSTAQALTAATTTKIQFQTEEFDTNSNFSSSQFTPTVAGYYQINAAIKIYASILSGQAIVCWIFKNGNAYKSNVFRPSVGANNASVNASSVVYLNGTTDYLEVYAYSDPGSSGSTGIEETYFNGAMVRGA
jgi:hypothetical protein